MIKWVAIIFVVCTACSSAYYVPNVRNVPTFTGKKEFQATAGYQLTWPDLAQGIHLQSAYSFTDHFGVMANYGCAQKKFQNEILTGHIGEIGFGYFENSGKIYYDFFAGYGLGRGRGGEEDTQFGDTFSSVVSTRTEAVFSRVFLQPNIAYRTNRITFSFALRMSLIHFNNTTTNLLTQDVTYAERQPVYYFEPTFTMIGSVNKKIKLLYQIGSNLTGDTYSGKTNFGSFSLGIRFCLSPKATK